jgi:hypothetical protein
MAGGKKPYRARAHAPEHRRRIFRVPSRSRAKGALIDGRHVTFLAEGTEARTDVIAELRLGSMYAALIRIGVVAISDRLRRPECGSRKEMRGFDRQSVPAARDWQSYRRKRKGERAVRTELFLRLCG